MIKKILIANRGEIACRIVRTCREMGIATAAVYSDADRNSLYVKLADEAIYLAGNTLQESYTNIEKIITAAQRVGADAVHPGYGFLAESAAFAQAVIDAGLNFIGPPPAAINVLSNKKSVNLKLKGLPTFARYSGNDQSDTALVKAAAKMGYPLMIKAAASSDGKGMWFVDNADTFRTTLGIARQISKQQFGDDTLLLDPVIPNARHIEVQIFGDKLGNIIALGERECSIHWRHQQLIDESPSTLLTSRLRSALFDLAVSIGAHLGYYSAGTVEYLLDNSLQFYFIGMKTCLTIAHAITEETTGFDLVRWQIMVAEGFPLPDMDVYPAGHAIEVRLYSEDASDNFPSPNGEILRWRAPAEVRIDSGVRDCDNLSENYDRLLAKVTAYGEHRQGAIRRLDYALSHFQILGVNSNVAFLRRVLMHTDYLAGNATTDFIGHHPELVVDEFHVPVSVWIAAAIAKSQSTNTLNLTSQGLPHYFKYKQVGTQIVLTTETSDTYSATIDCDVYRVAVVSYEASEMTLTVDNHRQKLTVLEGNENHWWVHVDGITFDLTWLSVRPDSQLELSLYAPTHGLVRAINASVGQHVKTGDVLMTLQVTNSEHHVTAPYSAEVIQIHQDIGMAVQAAAALFDLRPII